MVKRALLVGCNYPGTDAALRGCVNDVHSMHEMITTHYGFSNEHIRILIDTDQSKEQPTGANIKKHLKQFVAASKDGDVLFFHFSGHGTQIKDKDGGEADNLDEAICPTDMNLICDDDLRTILAPLSNAVKFTMVSDCCHSGSMLDHPEQQIAGSKDPNAPPQGADAMDAGQLMGMFFKGAGGADDAKNRSLPQDLVAKILGSKLGMAVDPAHVRSMLSKGFGEDATKKVMGMMGMAQGHLDKMAGGGGSHAKQAGMVSKLFGMCLNSGGGSGGGGGGGGVAGVPGHSGAGGQATAGGTEHKGPATGVLITGCQSNETSADACPSGDPAKAFGALTNALTTIVNAQKGQNPQANLSYQELVRQVRETLHKAKFTQNPCLECEKPQVSAPFIC